MRPVPKIENELDRMMEKTRNIPTQEVQGEWKFNEYYPKNCKSKPLCHMNELEFSWDKHGSTDKQFKFQTKGTKTGTSCSLKESGPKNFGTTWIRDSYMMFSNREDAPKYGSYLETPFIYDKHPTLDRLFVRDQKVDECWIVYDRKNQNKA